MDQLSPVIVESFIHVAVSDTVSCCQLLFVLWGKSALSNKVVLLDFSHYFRTPTIFYKQKNEFLIKPYISL